MRNYTRKLAKGTQAGIDVVALKQRLYLAEDMMIIDVRDEMSVRANAVILPRARWIPFSLLRDRLPELPLDKPIVVYCDCPEDQAAVVTSELLRQSGGKDVRPLVGGLQAWIKQGWSTIELKLEMLPA